MLPRAVAASAPESSACPDAAHISEPAVARQIAADFNPPDVIIERSFRFKIGAAKADTAFSKRRDSTGFSRLSTLRILLLLHPGTVVFHDGLAMRQVTWWHIGAFDLRRLMIHIAFWYLTRSPRGSGCSKKLDLGLRFRRAVQVVHLQRIDV